MTFLRRFAISLLLSGVIAAPARADFQCDVRVYHILMYNDGTVSVAHSGRGTFTHICNLNTVRGGINPTTCAMWTATLHSIKARNGLAMFAYPGTGTCASLATFEVAPVPTMVGNMNQ